MSESKMLAAVNAAVSREGFDDEVIAAGQFAPRGATGGMFAGGMAGDTAGGVMGSAGDSVGTVGGALAGAHGVAHSRGLPLAMVVGVSEHWVYGFAGRSRSKEPHELVFRLGLEGLAVSVGQRLNVRTLTLLSGDGTTRIELEGNRLQISHSKDVIDELRTRLGLT
ncbi:hypothetical protein [Solicola gregarius]|uniref:Uncharacterized protein n=1 Tax=Solicola gregarius TaxID=2908642 RepID=A0AA46TLI8_9ACTN|nr:hypothetical protein [Solicola gregarius]UYM07507.1 hypothetical protein L0C25_10690 [Solicola gregarius]